MFVFMSCSPLYFPVYGIREKRLRYIKFSEADNIWHIKKCVFFYTAYSVIYFFVYDI